MNVLRFTRYIIILSVAVLITACSTTKAPLVSDFGQTAPSADTESEVSATTEPEHTAIEELTFNEGAENGIQDKPDEMPLRDKPGENKVSDGEFNNPEPFPENPEGIQNGTNAPDIREARSLIKKTVVKQTVRKINPFKKEEPRSSTSIPLVEGILLLLVTILLPWLGVLLYEGVTTNFWITLVLWLLFYLPGLIYALIVIYG